ncbi:MAG: ParA family protein [Bryobacteraceae bacterium]|nr:ParA family protein [Bryobacteraceae bacterium]
MAKVLAFINLKGGVGKTTLSVATSEILAVSHQKRVLLIDLDPQTNSTVMLIGEHQWKELNDSKLTLYRLFRDEIDGERKFDIRSAIQKGVGNVETVQSLDLLASSLDLIDLQDHLPQTPPGQKFKKSFVDMLWRAVKPVMDDYDYVVIDCPPTLSTITLNGLRFADGYVIPVVPDILSTYGIPQILSRVERFEKALDISLPALGIAVTKYRGHIKLHEATVARLKAKKDYPPVFKSLIPDTSHVAAAATYTNDKIGTLRQKYGYGGAFDALDSLTNEIVKKLKNQ